MAILGAGVAGLSAAWRLHRRGVTDFTVLELEDRPGGTSRSGENAVSAFPWGAHYVPAPHRREERPGRAAPRDAGRRGRGRGEAGRWWASRISAGLRRRGSSSAGPGRRGCTRATPPAARTCASSGRSRRRWIGWWGRATQTVAGPSSSPPWTAGGCRRSMPSTGCRWPSSSTGAASPARGSAGTWSTPAATTTAAGWRRRRPGRAPSTSPRGSSGPGRAPRSW